MSESELCAAVLSCHFANISREMPIFLNAAVVMSIIITIALLAWETKRSEKCLEVPTTS